MTKVHLQPKAKLCSSQLSGALISKFLIYANEKSDALSNFQPGTLQKSHLHSPDVSLLHRVLLTHTVPHYEIHGTWSFFIYAIWINPYNITHELIHAHSKQSRCMNLYCLQLSTRSLSPGISLFHLEQMKICLSSGEHHLDSYFCTGDSNN